MAFDKHQIDNWVFWLHSQGTVVFLLGAAAIVTASTFVGDPIDCMAHGVDSNVLDTYCWIHSTFTLTKDGFYEYSGEGIEAHPGVGNEGRRENFDEDTTTHKYYQWVYFTLMFQAALFYLPK